MQATKTIEHKGIVQSIGDNSVVVDITATSACASCHARGACSVSDVQNKEIEIYSFDKNYEVGEEVNVSLKQSLGFKALFLGYVMPFILVLVALLVLNQVIANELIIGLVSLSLLAPYYGALFFYRNRLKKVFTFTINKIA